MTKETSVFKIELFVQIKSKIILGSLIQITIHFSVEVEAKVKVRTRVQLVDVNLKVSLISLLLSDQSSSGR